MFIMFIMVPDSVQMGNGARVVRFSPRVTYHSYRRKKSSVRISTTLRGRAIANLRRSRAHCDSDGPLWNVLQRKKWNCRLLLVL
jgi:hypothetical protein